MSQYLIKFGVVSKHKKASKSTHKVWVQSTEYRIIDCFDDVEDSKVRAIKTTKRRGGNGTNALVVCAQLVRNSCKWIGTCTDPTIDRDAAFVFDELDKVGIDCSYCQILQTGSVPTSYIVSSEKTGSRTIVHYRDLPELSVHRFKAQIEAYLATSTTSKQWFHFEGREMVNVLEMLRFIRLNSSMKCSVISVEIESLRQDWEHGKELVSLSDFAFVSKDYIQKKLQIESATKFLHAIRDEHLRFSKAVFCPWGSEGVFYITSSNETIHHTPTRALPKVVDSVGAGDTFIGAAIASLVKNSSVHQATAFACNVATTKCAQEGLIFAQEILENWESSSDSPHEQQSISINT